MVRILVRRLEPSPEAVECVGGGDYAMANEKVNEKVNEVIIPCR